MTTQESKVVEQKIKELQSIYADFIKKLNELKGRRDGIVSNILKRIEDKKIQENLDKLNKIK